MNGSSNLQLVQKENDNIAVAKVLANSLSGTHGQIQEMTNEQATCPSKNRATSGNSGRERRPSFENMNDWRCSLRISAYNEQALYNITECSTCQT